MNCWLKKALILTVLLAGFFFSYCRQKTSEDQIKKLIKDQYFSQYKGIVINFLSTRVKMIEPSKAEVQTEIALSSGVAKISRKLVKISTDNYRLRMKLIKKDNNWLIQYAEWKYVSLDQMFPESLKILEKIFGTKFSNAPKD